jgi:hypothetical protein
MCGREIKRTHQASSVVFRCPKQPPRSLLHSHRQRACDTESTDVWQHAPWRMRSRWDYRRSWMFNKIIIVQPCIAMLRMQVCRAACSAVAACAEAIGRKIEPLALYVLPELFRTVVGSIMVMTESADACLTRIVAAVHSPRLLARLAEVVQHDKNAKLRQFCSKYLLLALREWPEAAYESQLNAFKDAIRKAVGDATPGAPVLCSVHCNAFCTKASRTAL